MLWSSTGSEQLETGEHGRRYLKATARVKMVEVKDGGDLDISRDEQGALQNSKDIVRIRPSCDRGESDKHFCLIMLDPQWGFSHGRMSNERHHHLVTYVRCQGSFSQRLFLLFSRRLRSHHSSETIACGVRVEEPSSICITFIKHSSKAH